MKYLIYKSDARIAQINLLELLTSAREKNCNLGITGILIAHATGFVQYIEGPEIAINALFHNEVAIDSRHQNVIVVGEGSIVQNTFSDWDMGYLCLNDRNSLNQLLDQGSSFDLTLFYDFVKSALPLVEH